MRYIFGLIINNISVVLKHFDIQIFCFTMCFKMMNLGVRTHPTYKLMYSRLPIETWISRRIDFLIYTNDVYKFPKEEVHYCKVLQKFTSYYQVCFV